MNGWSYLNIVRTTLQEVCGEVLVVYLHPVPSTGGSEGEERTEQICAADCNIMNKFYSFSSWC